MKFTTHIDHPYCTVKETFKHLKIQDARWPLNYRSIAWCAVNTKLMLCLTRYGN